MEIIEVFLGSSKFPKELFICQNIRCCIISLCSLLNGIESVVHRNCPALTKSHLVQILLFSPISLLRGCLVARIGVKIFIMVLTKAITSVFSSKRVCL